MVDERADSAATIVRAKYKAHRNRLRLVFIEERNQGAARDVLFNLVR